MQTLLENSRIELMPLEFLILIGAAFMVIGFARGVRAELWATGMMGLGYIVLRLFTDELIVWTNRFYRLFLFGIRGGPFVENPIKIWNQIRDAPPLVETKAEKLLFTVVVFLGFYLVGFLVGRLVVKRKLAPVSLGLLTKLGDLSERLLGAVMGFVNGFLIVAFVLPRLLPAKKKTMVVVPSTEVVGRFMAQNLVNVGVVVLIIVILLGLMASGGLRQRG